jgi:ribosomal protein S18 acetylase RimI-like enzyme
MQIRRLSAEEATTALPALADLLQDAVHSGASVGFLPPLDDAEAQAYWQGVVAALRTPWRILLVAQTETELTGTVQLGLESRANGSHRAEVMKLMVHTTHRRGSIGRALMAALEAEARLAGRTTLVLDTRAGDPSEQLYTQLGYCRAGVIPEYARSANGALHSTVFMYKLLK